MSKKPVVLMILDGYGLNDNCDHNAVCEARTPIMDQLMSQCPFVKGYASGMAVGLPDGQMGNSEVGHLNMGAGRIVYQELTRITKSIQDGDFFENPAFLEAVENCKMIRLGRLLKPLSPSQKANLCIRRHVYKISDGMRKQRREYMRSITTDEVRQAKERLLAAFDDASLATLAPLSLFRKEGLRAVDERQLPS